MCDNSNDVVEELYKDGKVLRIMLDIDPMNPRDPGTQDNLAEILFVATNHRLGDDRHGLSHSEFENWDQFYRYVFYAAGAIWARPVIIKGTPGYGGDGVHVELVHWPPFEGTDWPVNKVGLMYVTEERIQELCGSGDEFRKYEFAMKAFESELWQYNQYLQGEVYGYEVVEIDRCPTCQHIRTEKQVDSCWGFYGNNWCENGLFDSAGWTVKDETKQDNKEASQPCQSA